MEDTKYDLIRVLIEVPVGMRDKQEIIKALYMRLAHFCGYMEIVYDHKYWSERSAYVSKMPHRQDKNNND